MIRNALVALAMLAIPSTLTAQINVNIGTSDRNGVCGVEYPFDNDKKLEISMRADNGNVNIAVHNLDGNYVDQALERDPEFDITLIFDDGSSVTSDFAAYRAGFTYRAMGAWNDPEGGHPVIAQLKTAKSMEVQFENERFGPVSTQLPMMGYNLLKGCVERNGGSMPV
ncbi:hypothetical protein [Parasphingorhabdus sp.]|uniref:hypothetical protein n=1 Tax=Parasphingorhabdus sp. TaxID=2709688 RepID=UPI0035932249